MKGQLTSDLSSSAQRSCFQRFKQQLKPSWHQVYHPLLKEYVLDVLNNNVMPVDIRFIILYSKIMFWSFSTTMKGLLTSDLSSSAQRSCFQHFNQQFKPSWHQVYHLLLKDYVLDVLNNNLRPVDIRFIILCSKIMFWTF